MKARKFRVYSQRLHADRCGGGVLQVVFRKGAAFCGAAPESAVAVPGILEAWVGELQAFQVLRAMHGELQAALQQRTCAQQLAGGQVDDLI